MVEQHEASPAFVCFFLNPYQWFFLHLDA